MSTTLLPDFLQLLLDGSYKVVDASVQTRPALQSAVLPNCLSEMKKSLIQYKELEPTNYVVDNGLKVSRLLNSRTVTNPYSIAIDGTDFVLADYNKGITIFDENFSVKQMHIMNTAPYLYPRKVAITDTHYIIGTNGYMLLGMNKTTGAIDWEFGTYNVRGKAMDGLLGRVYGIDILSNGNIMVATYDGAGDLNKYNGTVEEFDANGVWVKTHLQYDNTGMGADNETLNPRSLRVYNDVVYIGYDNRIDVFAYDSVTDTLNYQTAITAPNNSTVLNLALTDFVIDNGVLYIVSQSLKKVVGFDLTTRGVVFSVGHYKLEYVAGMVHEGNAMNDPLGIVVAGGKIYVADAGNYQVIEVFSNDYIYPTYDIPAGADIIYSSTPIENGTVATPVGTTPPNLHIVYTA